ncbi:MAG: DEAD/DEAH box helicase [Candidatus Cloacimonetes bacterium]|nr:DEAD/DEAH box helicase [Candidatus Cloacimonadota bacterium]
MTTFNEMNLSTDLLRAIEDLNFEKPMPVQAEVIPYLIEKNVSDMIVLAQTGTGKTAAYGLPLLQKIDADNRRTQVLILCPTRELCIQVAEDLTSYSKYIKKVKIAAVFGGASIERQIKVLNSGAQVICATPGRLLDLLRRKETNLSTINAVVLDEADEMLKMGFRDDLESILSETPDDKNTLLFSATMPPEVMQITKNYLKYPKEITIGEKNVGADGVVHHCYMVQAKDRYLALKRIVDFYPEIYGIVFCRTKKETQEVADHLMRDGYNAEPLHGDLSQAQRELVMQKFRSKHVTLLVATDVAARGLDVDDLTHVINYNLPDEAEVYTHRSGRTGRAGKKGISIIIANLREKRKISDIERNLKKQIETKKIFTGKEICEKQLFHMIDKMVQVDVNEDEINPFLELIYKKLEWFEREEIIKKFVSLEFNRFLDYYKDAKDLTINTSFKDRNQNSDINFNRFFINLGNIDKLTPPELIGLINDLTDQKHIAIGKIDIKKTFSFFEADAVYTDTILNSTEDAYFEDRPISIELSSERPQRDNKKRSFHRKNSQSGFNSDKRRNNSKSDRYKDKRY